MDAIVNCLSGPMGETLDHDREELLLRSRITFADPALQARSVAEQERSEKAIAAITAERTGRNAADLEVKCAAALIAVFTTLVRHWVEGDGKENLAALYERHLPMLSRGVGLLASGSARMVDLVIDPPSVARQAASKGRSWRWSWGAVRAANELRRRRTDRVRRLEDR
ncbi:hypothetical protein GCM10020367_14290 [Streptomyces sannanensis]|uniref:MftR C-terminal domain-containing protein n=1 Tax=Streptomyces sannanensis TaxID=285536 RepID=A0ABP6S7Y0_9ACTN